MTPTYNDVLAAAERLQGRIRRTPMLRHRALDEAAGGTVLVKPEPLQITGSFKLRGATNAALRLAPGTPVVTHSSGNHGQAVAAAAHRLGLKALIAMPSDAPRVKVEATKSWGAEIHFFERHGVPIPSISTTMKPSSAIACASARDGLKARPPMLPVCGPG